MQFAPYISSFLDIQRVEHEIWVVNQVDLQQISFSSILNSGGRLAVQQSCSDQCWLQGVESKL